MKVGETVSGVPGQDANGAENLPLGMWQSSHGTYEVCRTTRGRLFYKDLADGTPVGGTLKKDAATGWWNAAVFLHKELNDEGEGVLGSDPVGIFRVRLELRDEILYAVCQCKGEDGASWDDVEKVYATRVQSGTPQSSSSASLPAPARMPPAKAPPPALQVAIAQSASPPPPRAVSAVVNVNSTPAPPPGRPSSRPGEVHVPGQDAPREKPPPPPPPAALAPHPKALQMDAWARDQWHRAEVVAPSSASSSSGYGSGAQRMLRQHLGTPSRSGPVTTTSASASSSHQATARLQPHGHPPVHRTYESAPPPPAPRVATVRTAAGSKLVGRGETTAKCPPAPAKHLAEWLLQKPEELEARKRVLRRAAKKPQQQTKLRFSLLPDEVEAAIRMTEDSDEGVELC